MRSPLMRRSTHDREVADLGNALKRARADAKRVGEEKDTLYDNNQRILRQNEDLQRDIAARDLTCRGLAEERATALDAVGVLAADGETDVLRRVVVRHIADGLAHQETEAQARSLLSELELADLPLGADVKAALGGES